MNRFEGPSPALQPAPRHHSERPAQRPSGQATRAFKRIAQYASEPRTAVRQANELSAYHSRGWCVVICSTSARPVRLERAKAQS